MMRKIFYLYYKYCVKSKYTTEHVETDKKF